MKKLLVTLALTASLIVAPFSARVEAAPPQSVLGPCALLTMQLMLDHALIDAGWCDCSLTWWDAHFALHDEFEARNCTPING